MQRDELDYLIQRLQHANYPSDEDMEEARWLRNYIGKTGFIQLGWPHQGIMFLYEVSTEWYERYQHLLDLVEDFGTWPSTTPTRTTNTETCAGSFAMPIPQHVQRLAREAGTAASPSRGCWRRAASQSAEQAHKFLSPSLADLHSPYLMTGLRAAVERLRAAIERGETVLIYGDYDVDGTTAIVILKTALELCGGKVEYHVPHRIREGYGMRDEVIEQAAERGIRLIISVDTGIRAFAAAETAERRGIDLIVTDHHLPQAEGVPKALAVVNPNQPGCEYPVQVAVRRGRGLQDRAGAAGGERPRAAAAVVPEDGGHCDHRRCGAADRRESRLRQAWPGRPAQAGECRAARSAGQLRTRWLASAERRRHRLSRRAAPERRRTHGHCRARHPAVHREGSRPRPPRWRMELNQLNGDRQQEEQRILEEIHAEDRESRRAASDAYCLVIDGEGWHRGVIGICATRVVERYHRPALVFSCEDGEAHGSGRSIRAFHLLEALESLSRAVHPLRRARPRRGLRAARRAHSRVARAA